MGYILAVMGGVVSGIIFFGGLYWTVRKVPDSKNPALLSLISLVVRMMITLSIFYLVMDGKWQYIITALICFLTVRLFISSVYIRNRM